MERVPKGAGDIRVKTAILSVADKSGLVDFAKGLRSFGISLLATVLLSLALMGAGLLLRRREHRNRA